MAIEVNNHIITEDEYHILLELRKQLSLNGINRFSKIIETKDNIMTCCPFHNEGQEKKPSFGILTKSKGKDSSGTCHCFACGWTGSFSEMVSNVFGYDDWGRFGNKWLIQNFLSLTIESRPDIDLDLSRVNTKPKTKYVSEEELDSYREYHPYMWKRKLTPEIVELFDIGYDKERNCITFPIRDLTGGTLFIARRSVNIKFFQYPEGVEKPVYGLYELEKVARKEFPTLNLHILNVYPSEVIICESMLDALTCWVYGKYAVALNGLGNELQFEQLRKMPCRKFILATDNDSAGLKARQNIKKRLSNKIITEYEFPDGIKDINEMTKRQFDELQEFM